MMATEITTQTASSSPYEPPQNDWQTMLDETKILAIEERLAALPAVQKLTLATTLERLTPVINSMKGKGYSQEQIAAALTRELSGLGLTVSTRALARHVPAKPRAKRRAGRT